MKIVCESCGAKYSIADEKVAGKVFKIRCKKCSAVIVVKGDQPQVGAESTRVFDYGGEAVWHVVVGGEQQGPFAPRQIGELLAEGKIDWEAYVWREGMDGWQPAKDVEALVKAVMSEAEGGESPRTQSSVPPASNQVFGGSSDMGADPFASSDDGGLSGVIGQPVASATAAGGGADLFADASRSAFAAAAADDDESSQHGPGGKGGDAGMTGQRNENSVLFSLSNLQALATGSGAAPASGRPKPGMAQGEGSGLIDIRALASATQAVAEKPNGSSRDKVEDLLAVGATNTTFSAAAFAQPVASEKPGQNWALVGGMGAAILLLVGALTFLVVRQPEQTAELSPPSDAPTGTAATGAAGTTPAATTTPSPAEAPQAAEPAPPANEPAQQPTEARNDGEERSERSERDRSERRSRRSERDDKPEPQAAAEPAPAAPAPTKKSSGDKSLDDLLDTALSGKKPAASSKPAAESENLPSTPSREDVLAAMKAVTPKVQACGGGQNGVAMTKVGVAGPTGKVSSVDVSGQFEGTPAASCIAKEVGKAKFPKFSQSTFSFSYPFKI